MYGNVKTRRSPPGGVSQSSGFFQQGQGGRTVLPPLSSAFPTSSRSPVPGHYPNPYSQTRPSPAKAEHSASAYHQWPPSTSPVTTAQPHSSTIYEQCDSRYQEACGSYQQRPSPSMSTAPHGSRQLPPLSVHSPMVRDDRSQGANYGSVGPQIQYCDIRSPTATYPTEYTQYQHQTPYSYPPVPDPRSHAFPLPHLPHHCHQISLVYPQERGLPASVDPPYPRGPVTGLPLSQEPVSVLTTPEEPVIKKKRKRADAAQLKVLNETYARTAFPSTEERAELARKLDMSARSVQIWFQNKRQAARQTSRQASSSTNNASRHQPFAMTSQANDLTHASSRQASGSTRYQSFTPTSQADDPTHTSSRQPSGSTRYQSFAPTSQANDPTHALCGGGTSSASVSPQQYLPHSDSRPPGSQDTGQSRHWDIDRR